MFLQINNHINDNNCNVAYIYCCDTRIKYSLTYKDIKQEADQIIPLFNELPDGCVIGVQLGHKPCLLPVIYCLLQQKIAVILLEAMDSLKKYKDVKLYALISCENHAYYDINNLERTDLHLHPKFLRTKYGCHYKLYFFNFLTLEEQEKSVSYQNICFITATSGTLGQRKIVKVTEDSIYSNIKSFIKLFKITQEDVIYFGTPLSFDPALVELYLGLTTGACLLATPKVVRNNPTKLIDALFSLKFKEKSCTFLQMCPSIFSQFSAQQIYYIYYKSNLRVLGLGGEPFPIQLLPSSSVGNCKIYNFYGITEVSSWASVQEILNEQEVSLGTPLDDTEFYIENNKGHRMYDWKTCDLFEGTLYIGSRTRICYMDTETVKSSDEAVVSEKALIFRNSGDLVKVKNGRIFYEARANDVIKRFGHRISLINIQDIIYTSITLPNVCIFYKDKLICFIKLQQLVGNETNQVKRKTIDKIRVKLLKDVASEYMPDYLELLPSFPIKSSNGKLDKVSLESIAKDLLKLNYSGNSKDLFLKLWCQCLGIDISELSSFYDKTFWDSGGNSILAIQFAHEYKKCTETGLNRSLLDLTLQCALDTISVTKNTNMLPNLSKGYFNVVWKSDMKACIDSTPIICSISGNSYVAVGNFAHTFAVFNGNTGEEISSISLPNVIESAVLAVSNDFYVPCFDGRLYCLRLQSNHATKSLEVVWYYQTNDRLKNKPCFYSESIVFASYDGHVYAVSKDGLLQWKTFLGEPVTAEIKHFNEKLYIGALKSHIYCLSRTTGAILWKHKVNCPIFNTPEISYNNDIIIFVDIESSLYAFSIITDQLIWTFNPRSENESSSRSFGSMLIVDNIIILGTQTGSISFYEFDRTSCVLKTTVPLSIANAIAITSKPAMTTIENVGYLLVTSNVGDIFLYLMDFQISGKAGKSANKFLDLVDVYSLQNECFSSPQVSDVQANRFYLGCRDNNLYCIDINLINFAQRTK